MDLSLLGFDPNPKNDDTRDVFPSPSWDFPLEGSSSDPSPASSSPALMAEKADIDRRMEGRAPGVDVVLAASRLSRKPNIEVCDEVVGKGGGAPGSHLGISYGPLFPDGTVFALTAEV